MESGASREGRGRRRRVNVEFGGRMVDELGLVWVMMWMTKRPENGTENNVLYD
jgi:hypothetical protein